MKEKISLEELKRIKELNDNKIIIWCENTFRLVLKTVIDKVLRNNNGLPLEWEDIYYEFLYSIPKHIRNYDPQMGIALKTHLGIRCKYFALNKCKAFSNNKHKVLNKYVPFESSGVESRLEDSSPGGIPIDTSKLNELELMVYYDYYLEGMSQSAIEKNTGISRYKVKTLIDSVKRKLLIQIKN